MKNKYKAFLVILIMDSLTNLIFVAMNKVSITKITLVFSIIFSFIVIFILNKTGIIQD